MSVSKLFVGRLAWKTSKDTLSNYFNKYGAVTDARVILDRDTGRSKGLVLLPLLINHHWTMLFVNPLTSLMAAQ